MSLVLHLPLNGNLNNYGTIEPNFLLKNNLVFEEGTRFGRSLRFNGNAAQQLTITNVPKKVNNFTWACWVCPASLSGAHYILSQGRDCGVRGFNLILNGNSLKLTGGSSADGTTGTSSASALDPAITTLTANTWTHVAITVDEQGTARCYINSVIKLTAHLPHINFDTPSVTTYFTIGKMDHGRTGTTTYFPYNGYIADVRVYDNCISAEEVKLISLGLNARYSLSSESDITYNCFPDLTGHGHNAYCSPDSLTYDADAPLGVGSIGFGGELQYIDCGMQQLNDKQDAFTVNVYANMSDWSQLGTKTIMSTDDNLSFRIGGITVSSVNYLEFAVYAYSNSDHTASQKYNVALGVSSITAGWHMITAVYSTTQMQLYIDGALKLGGAKATYGVCTDVNSNLYLGGDFGDLTYPTVYPASTVHPGGAAFIITPASDLITSTDLFPYKGGYI